MGSSVVVKFFLVLIVNLIIKGVFTSSSLIVEAPIGRIKGLELEAFNKQSYIGFQAIPYARPPVGELRFAKPEPHPQFEAECTFDATLPGVRCPQPGIYGWMGQEDCLILNVYVKELQNSQTLKRKVLVFIHGGGFITGGVVDHSVGNFVTEQDVIVVTINYRLGVLGFLSTENEASPGNFALWDQALALKWVKDNIASFGGDPDDVTITGVSAGGASVSILSMSPVTKGLFTKVYPGSGTATSSFCISTKPLQSTLEFAKKVQCWDGETNVKVGLAKSEAIIRCLRDLPLSVINENGLPADTTRFFMPAVDGDFLPDLPSKLIKDDEYLQSVGYFNRSYLFGFNNNDMTIMNQIVTDYSRAILSIEYLSEESKSAIIASFKTNITSSYVGIRLNIESPSQELLDKIIAWYDRRYVNDSVVHILTDLNFLVPAYDHLDALARNGPTNAYFFYFNHYPEYMIGYYKGIMHGLDVIFWHDVSLDYYAAVLPGLVRGGQLGQEDLDLKYSFSSMLADFVRKGNPEITLRETNKLLTEWPVYDQQGSHYLEFSPDPIVRHHLEKDKKSFWIKTVPLWASELGYTVHTEF